MSLLGRRLAATAVALWVIAYASISASADALPDSTWVSLGALPHQGRTAVFALAVDPSNDQALVAGSSDGTVLKSTNGGGTWAKVHAVKAPLITISYSPFSAGLVLAGTRGAGALASHDGGSTWAATPGLEGRSVRVFAFALTLIAAGTDHGVYTSPDGVTWTASSLTNRSIDALAVETVHAPVRLVAGSDTQASGGALPLYQSLDGGATWGTLTPPLSGTITIRLVAGPLPPTGNVRPLIAGTNTGLFLSTDDAATFSTLSGGALLPTTDYTQVDFMTDHYDRYYVASDGGGSKSGGLWRTDDGGQNFTSLRPPQASVTALAVSNDENPTLYVATFQPSDHAATLWAYHDTFGVPQGPLTSQSPPASGGRTSHVGGTSLISEILAAPQLPYVGLGLGALAVVLTAVIAHLRGRYR